MTVNSSVACMKMLNEEDLRSLNLEWLTARVNALKEECETYLEKYDK